MRFPSECFIAYFQWLAVVIVVMGRFELEVLFHCHRLCFIKAYVEGVFIDVLAHSVEICCSIVAGEAPYVAAVGTNIPGQRAEEKKGSVLEGSEEYKLSRLMLRVRYYWGIPSTVSRSWFHMYGSTYGSVEGHEKNKDGLARNPRTGYQAMYRYGSHQSATRSWLRPTLMTDSLVRKNTIGQVIGKGFAPDVHCPNGAPRESFVKFTKAEDGGYDGDALWRPALLGFRPTYEGESIKKFLKGDFVK